MHHLSGWIKIVMVVVLRVFEREDIPAKFLLADNKPTESLYFTLNVHKKMACELFLQFKQI